MTDTEVLALAVVCEANKRELEREFSASFKSWRSVDNAGGLGVAHLQQIDVYAKLAAACRELVRLRAEISLLVAELPL